MKKKERKSMREGDRKERTKNLSLPMFRLLLIGITIDVARDTT